MDGSLFDGSNWFVPGVLFSLGFGVGPDFRINSIPVFLMRVNARRQICPLASRPFTFSSQSFAVFNRHTYTYVLKWVFNLFLLIHLIAEIGNLLELSFFCLIWSGRVGSGLNCLWMFRYMCFSLCLSLPLSLYLCSIVRSCVSKLLCSCVCLAQRVRICTLNSSF